MRRRPILLSRTANPSSCSRAGSVAGAVLASAALLFATACGPTGEAGTPPPETSASDAERPASSPETPASSPETPASAPETTASAPETTASDAGDDRRSLLERVFDPGPTEVDLPAGTRVSVRFQETLSSHETVAGQAFAAVVIQEVSVDGQSAIPSGAVVHGTVTEASVPRKVGGRARLGLAFEMLELPSGEEVPIAAAFADAGKSETPKDAAIIAGSTLGGAILGEAVDEGQGTVIGAIVGGVAGAIGAAKTKGKPVVVPAGTVMTIELTEGVTVPR